MERRGSYVVSEEGSGDQNGHHGSKNPAGGWRNAVEGVW